ncbi:hypothetical protein C479_01276 [Halovivax asiaticus JCM 14624]|uniref:YcaO domain-containing protein n=1 Tax=Halovivax asiaticus JCM 14624 TaxID=1227490 RepID=M0BUV8_9EURY|nr:YcaO-like family protein [Halovivax asiaticus]ELZ13434.1 hypothetical protein C479_01276 [Halovivax asiaticus JCM 14624]
MDVPVVGGDPVRDEVGAALTDVDIDVRSATVDELAQAPVGVVAGVAGSETFEAANRHARSGETTWIAVEVGGVGGQPIDTVDASVSVFGPKTACFGCLRDRVRSTRESDTGGSKPSGSRRTVRLAGAIAGSECVRTLEQGTNAPFATVTELPYTERVLLPVPGCACQADDRDRAIDRTDESGLALDETVDAMDQAIDERIGLCKSIGEIDSYPVPYYLATLANTGAYSDATAPTNAAGVDDDWNRAFAKAIGEGLERYCAGVYREEDFVVAAAETLDAVLEPTAIVSPDDTPAFDPSTDSRWVDGVDLSTGKQTSLPADAVHFPQPGPGYVPQITTGLGLGSSTADALVAGLTEIVERDATMLSWFSTADPVELSVSDERFQTVVRRVESEGLAVTPLLVTQDVDVPVVSVAVHREDGDWPAFAVGSAADLDATAAARSALAEATQNWMELRSIGPDEATDAGAWIGHYGSFPAAAREFLDTSETVDAASVSPDPVPSGTEAVETLVERLTDAGLTPYAARLTTRDVAALGFEAVRVIVPTAQPLFTANPYFGERARTVPETLGTEPRLDGPPHPYP